MSTHSDPSTIDHTAGMNRPSAADQAGEEILSPKLSDYREDLS